MMYFEPHVINYSSSTAIALAQASELAYNPFNQFEHQRTFRLWQFDRVQPFDHCDSQGFLAGNDRVLVLAFRGTEPKHIADWMTNLDIEFQNVRVGAVHRGFNQALDDIWDHVLVALSDFRRTNQPLLVTGHSLGGALATLAVDRLQWLGVNVQGLYTFGSPRVGNGTFTQNFDRQFKLRTFRFVNHNDIVPRVAPRSYGYNHVGHCFYFDAQRQLHTNTTLWQQLLKRGIGNMVDALNVPDWFGDHNLQAYQANLEHNWRQASSALLAA